MQSTHDFDVIIVGGGLVGAACALALKDSGLRLALVETKLSPALPNDPSWDSRVYAISPGSVAFLNQLGVWQTLDHSGLRLFTTCIFMATMASHSLISAPTRRACPSWPT